MEEVNSYLELIFFSEFFFLHYFIIIVMDRSLNMDIILAQLQPLHTLGLVHIEKTCPSGRGSGWGGGWGVLRMSVCHKFLNELSDSRQSAEAETSANGNKD